MSKLNKPLTYPVFESGITKFDKYGREIPDNRPLELLLTLQRAVKTNEQSIKEIVARELNKLATSRGFESLDESNDFNMPGDDYTALSGYEFSEEQALLDLVPEPVTPAASTPPTIPPVIEPAKETP